MSSARVSRGLGLYDRLPLKTWIWKFYLSYADKSHDNKNQLVCS